jgi:Tol biopolymer transport system component
MGEVYRARDARLDRDVAIKVLPVAFSSDPDRLARFQREAKVLAALNHPNVAQIYGVEESGGTPTLVMELVEGPTLADRIAKGPLPVDEAVVIARQLIEALDAAHERGIVHRDLKPANIKVRPDGAVKVLDFGLARASEAAVTESSAAGLSQSPTITSPAMMTQAGIILGTAAYMSPEQAKGREADKRSDIWAFGCVLYEMVTGTRAFPGEDLGDTLGAVLRGEADVAPVPPRVRRLVSRCLTKDPRRRLRDVGDALELLDDEPAPTVQSRSRAAVAAWITAGLASAALVALAVVHFRETPPTASVYRLNAPLVGLSAVSTPAISPDGRMLVFVGVEDGEQSLWVRELDSGATRPIAGTADAEYPFWSPDGRFVGFAADGKLKKIALNGGQALTLCNADNIYVGTWSVNDDILFGSFTSGLFRVSAGGGTATPVTELDAGAGEISHRHPWFLPDGRRFLYVSRNRDMAKAAIHLGDLNLQPSQQPRQVVIPGQSNFAYANGRLLFVRDQTLVAQRFDLEQAEVSGDALPLAESVDSGNNVGQNFFTVSQNGVLAFASGVVGTGYQLTWFDRSGKALGTLGEPGDLQDVRISPDGSAVAMVRRDPRSGLRDVWVHDVTSGRASRFTANADNRLPVWSPDGTRIAFTSTRGAATAYWKPRAGGSEEVVEVAPPGMQLEDWSDDGQYFIGTIQNATTNWDLWALPLEPAGGAAVKPYPIADGEGPERFPLISPNGRWVVFPMGAEVGRPELVFLPLRPGAGRWPVPTESVVRTGAWSQDGTEYFYNSGQDFISIAVEERGGVLQLGVPRVLFQAPVSADRWRFDVGPDGRFLVPLASGNSSGTPLTIVVNWPATLAN